MSAQNQPGGALRLVAEQQAEKLNEEGHLCFSDEFGCRAIADHYEDENDIGEESDDELSDEDEVGDSDSSNEAD
jgi:hypothetical protein